MKLHETHNRAFTYFMFSVLAVTNITALLYSCMGHI